MADNKVKFLRGTSAEYKAKTKDNDTFYYTTDTEKLYLGETEITGGGVTIDDTLSDTSKNPVQNKVINAALNSKANLSDIPTSLPADGGNADTVDGKHASDFVQKSGDSMSGNLRMETNQLWFGTGGITQFCFENTGGDLNLKNHDGTTVFAANYNGSFATNADALDGFHASDFVKTSHESQQIPIPNDVDVPIWIANNAKLYTRYYTCYDNTGLTNIAGGDPSDFVWYYFDGINIIATCNLTKKVWIACVANGGFIGWVQINTTSLPANGGNADTVDGFDSRAFTKLIATLQLNTSINSQYDYGTFCCEAAYTPDFPTGYGTYGYLTVRNYGSICYQTMMFDTGVIINRAKILGATEWTNWQRLNDGGNAATVNGLTVQTAVPANAKFTDTTYGNASTSAPGLVSTGVQTFAGNKTFNGQVIPAGASAVGTAQARKIYAGTSDMTAGTTALETGAIYLVYE